MAAEMGANGTMVAAVLESVGYYYHQVVLTDLTPAFKGSLGGFVYMIGVVIAIVSVAIRGGYKFGPWLLIGPPLFFAAVLPTTQISNARWKYATEARPQNWVDLEVSRTLEGQSGPFTVSTLFARYNELISNSVQEFVKIINQRKEKTDRHFLLKGQLLSELLHRQAQNPFLRQLMDQAMFGPHCAQFVNAAKRALDPNLPEAQKTEAKRILADGFDVPTATLSRDAAIGFAQAQGVSAGQMEEAIQKLMQKPVSCSDIWEQVKVLLRKDSDENVKTLVNRAVANGVSAARIANWLVKGVKYVQPAAGSAIAAEMETLIQASAKRSLMLAEDHRSFAGMINDQAMRGNDVSGVDALKEPTLSETEYSRGRSTEWSEKTRMITAANNLPYYQGLLLFFLALAYPFFAILLLIPGKHAGFILWFVLWLWVKSWDIGFAVVMQLDDIIYSLLSYSKELYPTGPHSNVFEQEFTKAMYMLKQSDPTFQLSTYYNLIACCLMAVPIVMSQFIIGSLTGGAGVVAQGMRASGEAFAGSTRAAQAQFAVSALRQEMLQLAADRANMKYQQMKEHSGGVHKLMNQIRAVESGNREAFKHGLEHKAGQLSGKLAVGKVARESGKYHQESGRLNIDRSMSNATMLRSLQKTVEGYFGERAGVKFLSIGSQKMGMIEDKGPDKTPLGGAVKGLMVSLANASTKLLDKMASAEEDRITEAVKTQGAWALYDTVYSVEGRRLAAEARVYGMLEVPWTADTGEFDEMKFEKFLWAKQKELEVAYTEAFFGVVTAGYQAAGSTFNSDVMKDMRKREAGKGTR